MSNAMAYTTPSLLNTGGNPGRISVDRVSRIVAIAISCLLYHEVFQIELPIHPVCPARQRRAHSGRAASARPSRAASRKSPASLEWRRRGRGCCRWRRSGGGGGSQAVRRGERLEKATSSA